jgi:hypothetical protein
MILRFMQAPGSGPVVIGSSSSSSGAPSALGGIVPPGLSCQTQTFCTTSRLTGLGWQLVENYRNSPHFGATFCYSFAIVLARNVFDFILGDFFTNSSGHPDHDFTLV